MKSLKLFAAVVVFVFIAAFAIATEPPQCNLPGWNAVKMAVKTVLATRAPHGHTHTCAHGHTWDHAANPTHKCQFCGMMQYVVDNPSRPVTIVRTVQVQSEPTPPAKVVAPTMSFIFSRSSAGGGCANGQCSTISRR